VPEALGVEPIGELHARAAITEVVELDPRDLYIPLARSATLVAGDERFDLRPGTMVRVAIEPITQLGLPARSG
jgi:hypothetical protein